MHVFWWGFKEGSIFHTHRSRISLSSGWIVKFCKQLNWLLWLWMTWNTERTFQTGHHQSGYLEKARHRLFLVRTESLPELKPQRKSRGIRAHSTHTHTHLWVDHQPQPCCLWPNKLYSCLDAHPLPISGYYFLPLSWDFFLAPCDFLSMNSNFY